jgi:hypothetical protein
MLAEGVHRPIPCRTDGKWLPNAGPEQPRGGGERPGLPPALLRKRCLSSCLNAAAVDPRSQAHAALRCPSLSLLGPSCCEAHGSLGDQVWRWLSAEGAENGHFAFLHAMQLFTASSQSPLPGRRSDECPLTCELAELRLVASLYVSHVVGLISSIFTVLRFRLRVAVGHTAHGTRGWSLTRQSQRYRGK